MGKQPANPDQPRFLAMLNCDKASSSTEKTRKRKAPKSGKTIAWTSAKEIPANKSKGTSISVVETSVVQQVT